MCFRGSLLLVVDDVHRHRLSLWEPADKSPQARRRIGGNESRAKAGRQFLHSANTAACLSRTFCLKLIPAATAAPATRKRAFPTDCSKDDETGQGEQHRPAEEYLLRVGELIVVLQNEFQLCRIRNV